MPDYTDKQGQYLAFIHYYTLVNGQPPAEADMQRFFRVSPPTVHQMVLNLAERGLISREPGRPRAIQVLLPVEQLPRLEPPAAQGRARQEAAPQGQIYQIKVTLDGSQPPIWRRILVSGDVTLARLHVILQVAMGWTDSHLHHFIVGDSYFGEPGPDYDDWTKIHDERRFRLKQITATRGFAFHYEYDFGDSWMHTLRVERILPPEPGQRYPVCLQGERACPPEDVGSLGGYYHFLEALGDPGHPEHAEYREWIGGEFDPEAFDLEKTNARLRRLG